MALRTNLYDTTTFTVLEVNNIVALRSGHIVSQVVLPKNKFLDGSQTYIQNGEIVFLDVDGKFATLKQSRNHRWLHRNYKRRRRKTTIGPIHYLQ